MESSITERAREFMESSRKSEKREKKWREENERARELLESSGSKGKKEKERMRKLLESGSKEKEKGEDVLMENGIWCVVDKMREKKKERKKKETYG